MASLRALLVLSEAGDVVFSRKWPTVERRAKALYGNEYEPVPVDAELKTPLLAEIIRNDLASAPTSVLALRNGRLWPIVFLCKFSAFIVAFPLAEAWLALPSSAPSGNLGSSVDLPRHMTPDSLRELQKRNIADLPFITSTIQILETVAEFVAACSPRFEQTKMAELHSSINKFIQFGRPLEVDVTAIRVVSQTDFPKQDNLQEKRPAWKPVSFKGRNRIEISIVEKIHSAQYDRRDLPDVCAVSGRIQVKAEIDGHPEVSLAVMKDRIPSLSLAHFHQSVTNIVETSQGLQLNFNPALGAVSLMKYSLDAVEQPPIRGFYQMRHLSSSHTKILLQLKLSDATLNQFESCVVELPFPDRHSVSALDVQPTIGTVSIDPKHKNVVLWNLGTKFSSKNFEAALAGLVTFDETIHPTDDSSLSSGFGRLSFRILDCTLSGMNVSTSGITVNPKPSVKKSVSVSRVVESGDYFIWNSLHQPPSPLNPDSVSASSPLFENLSFASPAVPDGRESEISTIEAMLESK